MSRLAAIEVAWPPVIVFLIAAGLGGTALAWNGAYFAGLSRQSSAERIVEIVSAGQVCLYAGTIAGPHVFALLVSLGVSYAEAFALFALLAAVLAVWLLRRAG